MLTIEERLDSIEKRLNKLERASTRFTPIGPIKPVEIQDGGKMLQDAIDSMKKQLRKNPDAPQQ